MSNVVTNQRDYDVGYLCAIEDAIEIAECTATSQGVIIALLNRKIALTDEELKKLNE